MRHKRNTVLFFVALWIPLAFSACDGGTEAPVPTSLTATSGDGQTAVVGSALGQALGVRVTDEDGKAVTGVSVSWTIVTGGGSLSTQSSQTGADGTATASWTLGTTAGSQQARASVQGLSAVTFSATATPGPAASITLGKTSIEFDQIGQTDVLTPVTVEDQYGNEVTGASVAYSSEDEAVATVDASGTVTAVGRGETSVTATSGSASASAAVTVTLAGLFPQNDTTVTGTVDVFEMEIPAGVTVTADGDVTLNVQGDATVDGTLKAACQALTLNGGNVTVTGRIENGCGSSLTAPPALTITSDGFLEFSEAEIVSDGTVTIRNTEGAAAARLSAAGFEPMVDLPQGQPTEQDECLFSGALIEPLTLTETVSTSLQDLFHGDDIIINCEGRLLFYTSTLKTQWGGDGYSQPFAGAGDYPSGTGGAGGRGGDVVLSGNTVEFGGEYNRLYLGGGGDGGDWYAEGSDPNSTGGDGARAGRFIFISDATATVDALDVFGGGGGHGGDAFSRSTAGGDARSTGGAGGSVGSSTGPPPFGGDGTWTHTDPDGVWTSQDAGNGGEARIFLGHGPDGSFGGILDGGDAGTGTLLGGSGGSVHIVDNLINPGRFVGNPGGGGGIYAGGGSGGNAAGSCAVSRTSDNAGDGGDGGVLTGSPGAPGTAGTATGPPAIITFDNFGNGGMGGASNSPGSGGNPSTNPWPSWSPSPTLLGSNFQPGPPGTDCLLSTTLTTTVSLDPGLHEPHIGFSGVITSTVTVDPPGSGSSTLPWISIDGQAPWVPVSGHVITETGFFTATGTGTVGGFPNVEIHVYSATLETDENGWARGWHGDVRVGGNGVFPGGDPAEYTAEATGSYPSQPVAFDLRPASEPSTASSVPILRVALPDAGVPTRPQEPTGRDLRSSPPWLPPWTSRLKDAPSGRVRDDRRE